jgi:hypothetical protein
VPARTPVGSWVVEVGEQAARKAAALTIPAVFRKSLLDKYKA